MLTRAASRTPETTADASWVWPDAEPENVPVYNDPVVGSRHTRYFAPLTSTEMAVASAAGGASIVNRFVPTCISFRPIHHSPFDPRYPMTLESKLVIVRTASSLAVSKTVVLVMAVALQPFVGSSPASVCHSGITVTAASVRLVAGQISRNDFEATESRTYRAPNNGAPVAFVAGELATSMRVGSKKLTLIRKTELSAVSPPPLPTLMTADPRPPYPGALSSATLHQDLETFVAPA